MPRDNSVFSMYVYILKCSDDSYYVGVTNNIETRVNQHNSGTNPGAYTYKRRPVHLVFYEGFLNPNAAIAFEKKIKGWSRKKKEALISGDFEKLKVLSKKDFKSR
jgi:putative endonuclease